MRPRRRTSVPGLAARVGRAVLAVAFAVLAAHADAQETCTAPREACGRGTKALAATAAAGEGNDGGKQAVVVPRCNEDLAWLPKITCDNDMRIVLYNKCDKPVPAKLANMPCFELVNQSSVGREGAGYGGPHVSFLSYVVDYYDKLPEMSWVIKATVRGFGQGTRPRPELFIPFQQKYAAMRGLTYMSFGSKKLGTFRPSATFYRAPFAQFFCGKKTNSFTSSARTEFAVHRNRVRRWPRCFYEKLRDYLVEENKRGRGGQVAYVLERLYNTIFSCSVSGCGIGGTKCKGKILCFNEALKASPGHFDHGFTAKRNTKLSASSGKTNKLMSFGRWQSTKDTYWNRRGKDWTS